MCLGRSDDEPVRSVRQKADCGHVAAGDALSKGSDSDSRHCSGDFGFWQFMGRAGYYYFKKLNNKKYL
jgi:hypothetical protein